MWTGPGRRCPSCGASAGADFLYCHLCGSALPPAYPYAAYPFGYRLPAYLPPPEKPRPADYRTRRGLRWTAAALLLFWIPGIAPLGGLALSVGSTYLFLDRRRFGEPHRRGVIVSYALLWIAAVLYVLAFGWFLLDAYDAWNRFRTFNTLQGSAVRFIWLTTPPTILLVVAFGLQVYGLLSRPLRWHVIGSTLLLTALVLVATFLCAADVPASMGPEPIRVASVSGVLNRIATFRLLEAPGFLWLAYLYERARGSVVRGKAAIAVRVAKSPPASPGVK